MTDIGCEAQSTNETPSFVRHQVLSDSGEPLFEIEIPHVWRRDAKRSFRRTCVKITTLEHSGRDVAVKLGTRVNEYEYRVLKFVWSASASSCICPEPIAFFSLPEIELPPVAPRDPQVKPQRFGERLLPCNAIIMSAIPGVPLNGPPRRELGTETRTRILREAIAWMTCLNQSLCEQGISPAVPGCFSDIEGRRCLDLPLLDEFVDHPIPETVASDGSVSLRSFQGKDGKDHNHLRDSVLACITRQDAERPEGVVSKVQRFAPTGSQSIRFCHMDLNLGNILVVPGSSESTLDELSDKRHLVDRESSRWQFSGLVDWEYAGWYTSRLEAYSGIFHSWAEFGIPIAPKNGKRQPSYAEERAREWSTDIELVQAAGSARMFLQRDRERERDLHQSMRA